MRNSPHVGGRSLHGSASQRRSGWFDPIMERRVRNDHLKAAFDVGIDVTGNHLRLNIIHRQCGSAGFNGCGTDITQRPFDFGDCCARTEANTPAPQPTSNTLPLKGSLKVDSNR